MTPRPTSIANVVRRLIERPDYPVWKPFCEFLDAFYEVPSAEAFAEEPSADFDQKEAAYLAATVEYLGGIYDLPKPAWIEKPRYFLDEPHYPGSDWTHVTKTMFEEDSPEAFRRRNIFTERRPLRRKYGPRGLTRG